MGHGKNKNGNVEPWKVSGISRKYPSYRNSKIFTDHSWLSGKRKDDGAERLWRIGDTLYDFTAFIDQHPGGKFWLQETKGTDITEPFASHHISTLPESLISKYKVRAATEPRNYRFTMHENGFYKTMKLRAREKLKEINYTPSTRTKIFHISLLLSTLLLAIASVRTGFIIFEILTGLSLCWLGIAAHNFFHRRDNWQMYTFNFTLLNVANWRISHALSHHVYTNSQYDLELTMFEPFLCWVPDKHHATKLQRIISVLIQPFAYAATFPGSLLIRIGVSLTKSNIMYWHDAIGFILPTLMYAVAGDASLIIILRQWFSIVLISSFFFTLIGANAAHHDPKIYHDGDAHRPDRDWGLYQIDTIIDRNDIKWSDFLVLTHFGEHILHHLFPTLDHGVLPALSPILESTLKEFGAELREQSYLAHIIGQNRQLLRTVPNANPPGLNSKNK